MKKYLDNKYSINDRVELLISEMTIAEKASQVIYDSPAVERLNIPEYNWWNECLHGVARAGAATVFPQAIGMAATFDPELFKAIGKAIALEARAKHHAHLKYNDRTIYKGLTFWSPNVNIFRDPRWGRGQETYGEDPYLTSKLAVEFIKGLQGDDPEKMNLCATAKHYAVHSGPEATRLEFDSVVNDKDLYETYLPAFKACVQDANVGSIMGAYNAVNGIPACLSKRILTDILREEWGFNGCVVSDAGAISAIHECHKFKPNQPEAAAETLRHGCDLITGNENGILEAYNQELISEDEINEVLRNLFRIRFKLGQFDDEKDVPLSDTPYEVVECKEHRELALETSRRSIVLLRNSKGILPLNKNLNSIAVIGPNADDREVLLGNYNGTPSHYVTPLEGIQKLTESNGTRIWHARGCELTELKTEACAKDYDRIAEAVSAAERSEVAIMFMGLSPRIEGEAGDAFNSDASGDKLSLNLPGLQNYLINEIIKTGTPTILVYLSGSALTVNWTEEQIPGVIQAWYPGAEGGQAIAEILFGETNPSGKLPVTFYKTTEELPDYNDYSMDNRTYKFMKNEALFPFGFGMSYTKFEYSDLYLASSSINPGDSVTASVTVKNAGNISAHETVQFYINDNESSYRVPNFQLAGISKIKLGPGETKTIEVIISPEQMSVFDNDGKQIIESGTFSLYAGGSQPDKRSVELTGSKPLSVSFKLL